MYQNPLDNSFIGPFSQLIIQFIKLKLSQGYKYERQGEKLSKFSHFSCNYHVENHTLSKELVEDWGLRTLDYKKNTQASYLFPIRDFAIYLKNLGYEAYIPAIPHVPVSSFVPHIFTQDELQRFFKTIDNITQRRCFDSTIPIVLPMLFPMLFGCGLRISEALNLKVKDIDFENGVLIILQAKGNKDRLVPMSNSLLKICQSYFRVMHLNSDVEAFFFYTSQRKRFNTSTIYSRYLQILKESGIEHRDRGDGPRIHDFRHTFAVLSMKRKCDEKANMYYFMPILSTYMGHENVYGTEKYIHLMAEFFFDLRNNVSTKTDYVIPEV